MTEFFMVMEPPTIKIDWQPVQASNHGTVQNRSKADHEVVFSKAES